VRKKVGPVLRVCLHHYECPGAQPASPSWAPAGLVIASLGPYLVYL